MFDYREYKLNKREAGILLVGSVALAFLIGFLFYDTPILLIVSPGLFFLLKPAVENILEERRIKLIREQFRDILYSFSTSFAAGMHMEEAMESAILQIRDIYGEEAVMANELVYMLKRIREAGENEVNLWMNLAKRSGLEDIQDFAQVFSACRDAGGNLVSAVDRAANLIVEKINVENEMRLMFSQKKLEGHMIGLMPIVMVLFLRISSPGYLAVMYTTFVGRGLMTLALLAMGVATYLTEKITRVDI